jgi:hypothetical protein
MLPRLEGWFLSAPGMLSGRKRPKISLKVPGDVVGPVKSIFVSPSDWQLQKNFVK